MDARPEISIVIPTLGRPAMLRRVLDRLDGQASEPAAFEVLVVADAKEERLGELDEAVSGRAYQARRLQGKRPGASAARNAGWRAAAPGRRPAGGASTPPTRR